MEEQTVEKENIGDKLTPIAIKQFQTGSDFKRDRMTEIAKNEEFYLGRKIRVPKGRFGVPLPVMAGYVDDLMSKIDDGPSIKFGYRDIADLRLAQKVSSAWEIDSHPNKANWALKDRWAKKLAIFSGRANYKVFSESEPDYKHYLEIIDHNDLITEPLGGGNLEDHKFCGLDNIFRTKSDIEQRVKSGAYNAKQAEKMFSVMSSEDYKKKTPDDSMKMRTDRLRKLGLNLVGNEYVGTEVIRLVEWYMEHEGERYYLLFEPTTGCWLRCSKLKEVFESNLWPIVSWATHEDPFNFWSKAPCDDMRPVAEAMDILFNQALENREKANWGQRAYDPAVFPNPEELEWRPNGLVMANATIKGKNISQGIYEFKTPEINGTIDLLGWMRAFTRTEVGLSGNENGAQNAQDEKVGIYFGRLQQMADRVGLHNKSYRECHLAMGLRYAHGLSEHLKEPMLVRMIGESGVEWSELTKGEAKKSIDLDLDVSGGSAEVMANEAKARRQAEALATIGKNQNLMTRINQDWYLTSLLKQGFEDAEIRVAVSRDAGNLEMLSRASQSIQDIIAGKNPKLYRGASTVFIQKILDFATEEDLDMGVYNNLISYARKHIPIVQENMARMATFMKIDRAMANPEGPISTEQSIGEGVMIPDRNAGSPIPPGVSGNKATSILKGESSLSVA